MPSVFGPLIDLQDIDLAMEQLRHKRAHLPERSEMKANAALIVQIVAARQPAIDRRTALAKDEKRLEDEARTVEAKAASEDKRMYSGTVSSPRELQAIGEEIASLKRRQSELEDRALEIIVEIEPLDEAIAESTAREHELRAQQVQLEERITVAEAEIGAQLGDLEHRRAEVVAAVTAVSQSVVAHYEDLRKKLGGIAAAKLEAGSCRGCHLKLSAVEFDRVMHQPADAIVHCEECGRILVR